MDIKTFVERGRALETRLSERGFIKPDLTIWVDFCGHLAMIRVEAQTKDNDTFSDRIKSPEMKCDTVEEIEKAFVTLETWIDEQKTPDELREAEFVKNMAYMVEEARALDVPILPDLEATMKRLSENIIEFKGAVA